jgi:hypothetical protein
VRVGLGWSTRGSEAIALREALAQAAGKSGEPRFAFLFATPQYNPHRVWEAFREFVPSGRVLGCSAEGVIVEGRCLSLGLVVLTLGGEDVEAWTIAPALHSRDPYTLGEAIGRAVRKSSLAEGTCLSFPIRLWKFLSSCRGCTTSLAPGSCTWGVEREPFGGRRRE